NKSLSDIGISPSEVGVSGAWSAVIDAKARPPRDKGIKIEDSGEGGLKLAEFLQDKRLV
ncbi:MAG: electron transfer flavoprotein subunit beta, partial [Actinobacteria bacterium]|nr:electron transfer flavoprotein subunit beta [Actinomycetota bacterium]